MAEIAEFMTRAGVEAFVRDRCRITNPKQLKSAVDRIMRAIAKARRDHGKQVKLACLQ